MAMSEEHRAAISRGMKRYWKGVSKRATESYNKRAGKKRNKRLRKRK